MYIDEKCLRVRVHAPASTVYNIRIRSTRTVFVSVFVCVAYLNSYGLAYVCLSLSADFHPYFRFRLLHVER